MVALQNDQIVLAPIRDAVHKLKLVTQDHKIFQAARQTGIFLGNLEDYFETAHPEYSGEDLSFKFIMDH